MVGHVSIYPSLQGSLLINWLNNDQRVTRHLEAVCYNLLVPCPGRDFTNKYPKCAQANPCFRLFICMILCGKQGRRKWIGYWRRGNAYRTIQGIVDQPRLIFGEPFQRFQVSDCCAFRKRLDTLNDLSSVLASLGQDGIICNYCKFSKRDQ